eukprot:7154650-Prymnesium_polylepis.3
MSTYRMPPSLPPTTPFQTDVSQSDGSITTGTKRCRQGEQWSMGARSCASNSHVLSPRPHTSTPLRRKP